MAAVRELDKLFSESRILLVGAVALGFHIEMTWRATEDIDVTLSIDVSDVARIEALSGWRRIADHRWEAPGNVIVDVVPADTEALASGYLRWPSGSTMRLLGFRAAFKTAEEIDTGGVIVGVPPAATLVVLKMIAYQDSPASREKDLSDIAHVLDEYLPVDDPRRFEDEIYDAQIDFEDSCAFLLGRDIGGVVDPEERAAVLAFLDMAADEKDPYQTAIKLVRSAPSTWGFELADRERSLETRLGALQLGCAYASGESASEIE